jgi:hypothetical protein
VEWNAGSAVQAARLCLFVIICSSEQPLAVDVGEVDTGRCSELLVRTASSSETHIIAGSLSGGHFNPTEYDVAWFAVCLAR